MLKKASHFSRFQTVHANLALVVEYHTRCSVSHLIAKSKLVAVVDPFGYENRYLRVLHICELLWKSGLIYFNCSWDTGWIAAEAEFIAESKY